MICENEYIVSIYDMVYFYDWYVWYTHRERHKQASKHMHTFSAPHFNVIKNDG